MALRRRSARLLPLGSLMTILAANTALRAAPLPEPVEDASGVSASRLATRVPIAPRPLPSMDPTRFAPTVAPFAFAGPYSARETLSFSSVFRAGQGVDFQRGGFSTRLLSRMNLEALRYRETNVSGGMPGLGRDAASDLDSSDEARRSSAASRVITRSSHRAMTDELEQLGRTSLGLGGVLDRLQNLSFRRARPDASEGAAGRPVADGGSPAVAPSTDGLRGDIGLRLDAHPALMLRARLGAIRGRLDLPVLNEPIRLSVESPVGARGRAVLSSGLPRDGQPWATLTFSFGF